MRRVRHHHARAWKFPTSLARLLPAFAVLRPGVRALLRLASARHAAAEDFRRLPMTSGAAPRFVFRIRKSAQRETRHGLRALPRKRSKCPILRAAMRPPESAKRST